MITTLLQYFQVRFNYLLKVTRRDHFRTCKIAQNKKKKLSTKLRTLPVAIYILHATDKLKKKKNETVSCCIDETCYIKRLHNKRLLHFLNRNFIEFENVGAECMRQTIKLENSVHLFYFVKISEVYAVKIATIL